MQDIRIVELVNWGRIPKADIHTGDSRSNHFSSFAYFDEIQVHTVDQDENGTPLAHIYDKIQAVFRTREKKNCEAQQLITIFTDVVSPESAEEASTQETDTDISHTREEIEAFWSDNTTALVFMTMINVSLCAGIKKEMKRIKQLFSGQKFLLYQTFEYNELLLFFKGNSFEEYSQFVMELCFSEKNTGVLDSITVCSFQQGLDADMLNKVPVSVHLQLGTRDYQKALAFLNDLGLKTEKLQWLLGRNDICFVETQLSLRWLYDFCCKYDRGKDDWISTLQIIIPLPVGKSENLIHSPNKREIASVQEQLEEYMSEFFGYYHDACQKMNIFPDDVFLRMLQQICTLVLNVLNDQLAQELAICLVPALTDFIEYLKRALNDDGLKEYSAEDLRGCLNSFYLNVLSLINSTVHSNQEFIQIPNCSPPKFEMPPKIMAFYTLAIHDIIRAFRDEDNYYGVMLSPKLVDELEVESLAIKNLVQRNQFLSVNIGEKMLYEPQNTVAILGHEMAHFVGEKTRMRAARKEAILSYFSYFILNELYHGIEAFLPEEIAKQTKKYIHYDTSFEIAKCFGHWLGIQEPDRLILDKLVRDIEHVPDYVLGDSRFYNKIIDQLLLPMFQKLAEDGVFDLAHRLGVPGRCDMDQDIAARYRAVRVRELFAQIVPVCRLGWNRIYQGNYFQEYVRYLFSETYADLAMIVLFDMEANDYLELFFSSFKDNPYRPSETEDVIELTRFMAVFWSLCSVSWKLEKINYCGDWPRCLAKAAGLVSGSDSKALEVFCKENEIDYFLLLRLKDYLKDCAEALQNQFSQNPDYAIKVRKIYTELKTASTAQDYLHYIRSMETDYLVGILAD